jgi:hypothetical protein
MPRSNEQSIQQAIRLLSRGTIRLFRNNVGALRDATGRLVRYGLAPGSSDLIGWRTLTITPDMVGQTVAQFVALEIKDQGRATPQQAAFLHAVHTAGGLAALVRSEPQAQAILTSPHLRHDP